MSVIARGTSKSVKIIYPPGCKEVTDELGKDELVRRLKLIARAFQEMGQEDNEQYSGLALHVASDFFIEHTNKDVRLLAACCVADVFRVFAPEAPYRDASQLKDLFMFLIKQLRGLEDPNSPTFKRYFYLLENLAWVKSFNICIELDDNQEIFCSLYKLMFSIVNEKHTTKVQSFMLDMMSPLLTEADNVSQELLDILLINIVEPHKTQNRQAYNLAKELLSRTCNAIEPYVQAFFNNALMLGKTSESELSEHLYDLIYELNVISPSVLLAVLPQLEFKLKLILSMAVHSPVLAVLLQLEFKLKSNEESERKAVTKILSKMFSDPGSNLAEQNKPLWNCFLGRFNDISITVRTVCVQSASSFVLNHPELIKDVVEQVKIRQHDGEETVRVEVVNTLLTIAKKNFDVMSDDMLDIIKERTRDKKYKIRRDALMGLGQLYKGITLSEDVTQSQLDKVVWVKDKVFHAYYQQNPDDKLMVERLFNICLVPYTMGVTERMKRLYQLYATLDEPAVKAFNEMMKHRHGVRQCMKMILDGLDRMTVKPVEFVNLTPKLYQLARTLPEPQKSIEQVRKLHEILRDDRRMRSLMRYLISNDCNCRKANENVKEIMKKLGGGSANSSGPQLMLYNTVKSLLERVAPVMVDAQAISVLVKHIDDGVRGQGTIADGIDKAGEKGVHLLLCLSSVFPQYFKGEETFDTLVTFLKDEDEIVVDSTLQIFTNFGQDLETHSPAMFTKLLPILQHTAKIGSPTQAKHAIRCINKVAVNKEAVFSSVFEHVKNNINAESANFITSIVALGHISHLCPTEFAASMKSVVSKDIVKDLLMQDRTHGQPVIDSWYADHLVTEETQAKLQSMKLLVRWLMGLRSNTNNSCTSTLRLLYTVIVHEGDLMEKALINKPELARLRLQAGCCLLKLAEEPVFADLMALEQFQALALLINDSCFHVRLKFASKLNKGLYSLKLPLEFMAIFCLAANDPMRERRTNIKKFIQMNIQRRRDYLKQNPGLGGRIFFYLPDYVMPYTIHLLAHDPDLTSYKDIQALKNIKECLWFIMEPLVARSEDYNYHFFRRLIENIKQTKDAQDPEDEETNNKLYAVCDLALGLLQKNLTNIVLKDSNVDPVLPSKLYTKPDKGVINSMIYLPKDFNFEKKKGMIDPQPTAAAQPQQGKLYFKAKKPETFETIIVASPGPVVNPNPTWPREPKAKPVKKQVEEDSSESQASAESESSQTTKRPTRSRRKAANVEKSPSVDSTESEPGDTQSTEDSCVAGTSRDSSVNDGESDSQMETEEGSPSPLPQAKKRTAKRKSAAESSKSDKVAKKVVRKSSNTSDVEVEAAPRKRGKGVVNGGGGEDKAEKTDSQDSGPAAKKRKFNIEKDAVPSAKMGKGGKKAAAGKKSVASKDSMDSSQDSPTTDTVTNSQSTGADDSSFKSPSSPAPKATPVKKGAKGKASPLTVTRGKLKSASPSPASSPSSSDESPKPVATKKGAAAKKGPKPLANATVKIVKNVRKTKPLSNGTTGSDSDTKGTPKKAIQKGKKAPARGKKK